MSKEYSAHKALDQVSLSVSEGSIFGLLGPNGAGKTTLIRIINQIIQADSGEVQIKGEKLNTSHIGLIGYLPEERGLYKKMKVGEQLIYLGKLRGLSDKEVKSRISFWFQKFELDGWWNKSVEDLSKGMQQKIQFIATVLHEPKLIILDEPFSGFDPVNANLIKQEILGLRDRGASIIFSTHRMESVEELCDHIALINRSRKILEGATQDIRNQYRDGTYRVQLSQPLNGQGGPFDVLSSKKTTMGKEELTIKAREGSLPNDVLSSLMAAGEVHHFEELVPTMNDIFIKLVTKKDNG